MTTRRTLAQPEWKSFFDSVTDTLLGKRVEVEAASLDLGDQIVAEWVPLLGVSYDPHDDLVDVALGEFNHRIERPRELYVQEGAAGVESMAIQSGDGVTQVLHLKEPLMLPAGGRSEGVGRRQQSQPKQAAVRQSRGREQEGIMKVRDIMTAQPRAATPGTNLAAAAQLLWSADCGILPVVDGKKLVGVVTDRDMYVALATRNRLASQITVGDVAAGKVWTCGPDDDVHVALETMQAARVRRLPVTQDGALVGVISINDLILAAGANKPVRNEEVLDTLKAICAHAAASARAAA